MARLICIYVVSGVAHIPTLVIPGEAGGSFVAEPVMRVAPVSAEALLPVLKTALEADNPRAVGKGFGGSEAVLHGIGFTRWESLQKKAKYYTVLNTGKVWYVSPHLLKRGAFVPDPARQLELPLDTSIEVVAIEASRLIAGS